MTDPRPYAHGGWMGWLFIYMAVVGFVLVCVGAAMAGERDEYRIQIPPARFDHAPARPIIEVSVDWDDVARTCDPTQPRADTWACSRDASYAQIAIAGALPEGFERRYFLTLLGMQPNACVIVLPRLQFLSITENYRTHLRRHEIAHCNGWGWNHED